MLQRSITAAIMLLPLLIFSTAAHAALPIVTADVPWLLEPSGVPVVVRVASRSDVPIQVTLRASCTGASAVDTVSVRPRASVRRTLVLPAQRAYDCKPGVTWDSSEGGAGRVHPSMSYDVASRVRIHSASSVPVGSSEVYIAPDAAPGRWSAYPAAGFVSVDDATAEAALDDAQRDALTWFSQAGGRLELAADVTSETRAAWRARGAVLVPTPDELGDTGLDLDFLATSGSVVDRFYPVPGTEELPVAGFMILVLIFALVVGPLNLWWVIYRKRRRGLFLVTTPLLSAGACALMLGYNVVAEGLEVERAAVQLTWLDVDHHRAVTWTGATYFAGLGVDETTLPADTAVTPISSYGGGFDSYSPYGHRGYQEGSAGPIHADYRGGGVHLAGAIVPSRVNQQYVFTTPHAERRRLQVTLVDGGYTVTNHLDVAIRSFRWLDHRRVSWTADAIGPGATAPLTELPGSAPVMHGDEGAAPLASIGSRVPLPADLERLDARARKVIGRHSAHAFIAELDAPLVPIPGPEANDVEPVRAYALGLLPPERPEATP